LRPDLRVVRTALRVDPVDVLVRRPEDRFDGALGKRRRTSREPCPRSCPSRPPSAPQAPQSRPRLEPCRSSTPRMEDRPEDSGWPRWEVGRTRWAVRSHRASENCSR
jgi:hypothetical protein